jgi:hypothetical protein
MQSAIVDLWLSERMSQDMDHLSEAPSAQLDEWGKTKQSNEDNFHDESE